MSQADSNMPGYEANSRREEMAVDDIAYMKYTARAHQGDKIARVIYSHHYTTRRRQEEMKNRGCGRHIGRQRGARYVTRVRYGEIEANQPTNRQPNGN